MSSTEKTVDIKTISKTPHYVAKTIDGWGIEMHGLEAMDGSITDHAGILGLPMINFTVEGSDIKKACVRNKRGKWLPYKTGFGMNNSEALGDDTAITGIEIVGSGYLMSVHIKGGSWLNPVKTSDIEGQNRLSTGAVIDAVWIEEL